jgi:hypothetical protein
MTSLLTRLREATIGSAELDLAIAEAIGKWASPLTDDDRAYLLRTDDDGVTEFHRCYDRSRWTSSLDDAVMLVPAHEPWAAGESPKASWAWIGCDRMVRKAATPALAVCIAVLVARGIE